MMPISYILLPDDVTTGARLGFIRIYRKNALRTALTIIAIAGVISGGIELFDGFDLTAFIASFLTLSVIYLILAIILIPIIWFIVIPRKTKKTFQQMPEVSREQSISWDELAITTTNSQGNARVLFAEFHRWASNEHCVIIYPADHIFYVFPRRIFTNPHDFEALIDVFRRSGVQRI